MVSTLINPKIILGTWINFHEEKKDFDSISELFNHAWSSGIRDFDTANNYGGGQAEINLGKCLVNKPRTQFRVNSKVFFPTVETNTNKGLSRQNIIQNVDESLDRLKMNFLDLYICHRFDPDVPLDETIQAMGELINHGKIKSWGISQWPIEQIINTVKICDESQMPKPKVSQFGLNILNQSDFKSKLRPILLKLGIDMQAHSPLAGGFLTCKYLDNLSSGRFQEKNYAWLKERWFTAKNISFLEKFSLLANQLNLSCTELALQWIFSQNVESVVMGFSSIQQIDIAISVQKKTPNVQVLSRLESLSKEFALF